MTANRNQCLIQAYDEEVDDGERQPFLSELEKKKGKYNVGFWKLITNSDILFEG